MSSTRCEVVNWLLVPLSACVLAILGNETAGSQESAILVLLTLVAILAHVHYGVCVVRQMCRHFGINCFSLTRDVEDVARQKLLQDRQQHD